MSSEVVLQLDIIRFFLSLFVYKNGVEVLCEQVCVGGQVKLEISVGRQATVMWRRTQNDLPKGYGLHPLSR